MSSARMTRRGRTRVRIRPVSSNSTESTGNDRQSPTTPPQLSLSSQPSLLIAKEQSRKKSLKQKYHIDDLELKNTLGELYMFLGNDLSNDIYTSVARLGLCFLFCLILYGAPAMSLTRYCRLNQYTVTYLLTYL